MPAGSAIVREEIFGPVAAIMTFETEEDVIAAANDTEYSLIAYVYTRDLSRGLRVSERLESGMIGLNRGLVSDPAAPFGGSSRAVSAERAPTTAFSNSVRPNISRSAGSSYRKPLRNAVPASVRSGLEIVHCGQHLPGRVQTGTNVFAGLVCPVFGEEPH